MPAATHGASQTKEYRAWINMIQRCENPNRELFDRYGGRGIRVCDRWRHSFEAFLEDMGHKPFPAAQLDREDNDGDYEPGNCRWAAPVQNSNNRSTNVFLEFAGRRLTVNQWARELNIHSNTLRKRLQTWTVEAALTMPVRANGA